MSAEKRFMHILNVAQKSPRDSFPPFGAGSGACSGAIKNYTAFTITTKMNVKTSTQTNLF